jgi:hypothetical protein
VVPEYGATLVGKKGAVLPEEGLLHSHVNEWTAARDAGAHSGLGDAGRSVSGSKVAATGKVERLHAENVALLLSPLRPDPDSVGHHGKSTVPAVSQRQAFRTYRYFRFHSPLSQG